MHHEVAYSVHTSVEARSLDTEGPSFKMSLTMMEEEEVEEEVDAEVRREEETRKRSYRMQEWVECFLAF